MKRMYLKLIFILIISTFLLIIPSLSATSLNMVKLDVKKSGVLSDGVTYESFTATTTNDSNSTVNQNISYVKKDASSGVKVVAWSKIVASTIVGTNMIGLAQDFEAKNPGYKVIAGINGDYYDPPTKTPVNALVQNSDVIKFSNFSLPRYFSIGINDSGTDFITSKNNALESDYVLSIYDQTATRVVKEVKINNFNTIPNSFETSVYYKNLQEYEFSDASLFLVENLDARTNYGTHFLKGRVTKETNKTVKIDTQMTIVTKDPTITALLQHNPIVRVQKNLKDVNNGYDNIIGVGSQPLKNGVILTNQEIGDQSVSFAEARAPRSSIGFTEDGSIIIATIDGRQTNMAGASLREEAYVMKALGCNNAFNFDGGGSTQLMIKENGVFKMLNSPSETYRSNSNGILFVVPEVFIDVEYSNLTASTIDIDFSYKLDTGITLKALNVYVNENKTTVSGNSFTLTNLLEYGINYISFEAVYEKNNITYTRSFISKRVNIENTVEYTIPPKVKPSMFTITFEKIDDNTGFEAIINFDDPNNTMVKLYIINDGKKEILLRGARGYVYQVKNISTTTTYSFEIEYHYILDNFVLTSEIYEDVFAYEFEVINGELPDQPLEKGCAMFNFLHASFMLLSLACIYVVRSKRWL